MAEHGENCWDIGFFSVKMCAKDCGALRNVHVDSPEPGEDGQRRCMHLAHSFLSINQSINSFS